MGKILTNRYRFKKFPVDFIPLSSICLVKKEPFNKKQEPANIFVNEQTKGDDLITINYLSKESFLH